MRGLFIALCFIMVGCTELVTSEFPKFETVPTVNSILVEGKPLSVLVSLTGKIDSLPLSVVNNAIIDLYIDGKFSEQLENSGSGTYFSKSIILPEKDYKCLVKTPNMDTVMCSQNLPVPSPIISVEHINIAGRDEEGNIYHAFKLSFRNNPSELRYYEVKTTAGAFMIFTDRILLNEGLPIALFSNELIKDSTYTLTLNYSTGYSRIRDGHYILNPFIVELRSVTYDYYCYQKQYYLYHEGRYGNITTKATAYPLYSNIENGYGIFAGYSVFVSDTIRPEPYDLD
jgi:hypothetical protein